ncbi:MAG: hypothetical protein RSB61_02550 [Clostridia bacterium]
MVIFAILSEWYISFGVFANKILLTKLIQKQETKRRLQAIICIGEVVDMLSIIGWELVDNLLIIWRKRKRIAHKRDNNVVGNHNFVCNDNIFFAHGFAVFKFS